MSMYVCWLACMADVCDTLVTEAVIGLQDLIFLQLSYLHWNAAHDVDLECVQRHVILHTTFPSGVCLVLIVLFLLCVPCVTACYYPMTLHLCVWAPAFFLLLASMRITVKTLRMLYMRVHGHVCRSCRKVKPFCGDNFGCRCALTCWKKRGKRIKTKHFLRKKCWQWNSHSSLRSCTIQGVCTTFLSQLAKPYHASP